MKENNPDQIPWPQIYLCKERGIIDELDLMIAKTLLKEEGEKNEEWAFFLCHMSRSLREGSLAVSLEDGKLTPSPLILWKDKKNEPTAHSIDTLSIEESVLRGANLPPSLVCNKSKESTLSKPVIREGNRFYFQRSHLAEEHFLGALKRFLKQKKASRFDNGKALAFVESMVKKGSLENRQAEACLAFKEASVTLIMGGPGTGKTYTAAMIVKMVRHSLNSLEPYKIALAAPTGKAASNLKQALMKCGVMEGFDEPKTIHSLLSLPYQSKEVKTPYQLSHDLYIIDEASMIDIELMTALFKSMKPTAKVIFLGDPNQLPPIDLGSPFSDIAEARDSLPPSLRCVELDVSIRCETKDILELSRLMLDGDGSKIMQFLKIPKEGIDWQPLHQEREKEILSRIVQKALEKYSVMLRENLADSALFQLKSSFTVLTPYRVGLLGSDGINQAIAKAILSGPFKGPMPIIILENKPELGLFNGDIGFLKTNTEGEEEAIFLNQGSLSTRTVPAVILPKHEWAFCLSIHKSQGSEFLEALIILPEGSEHFGRKIAYTALTRVKRHALLLAGEETLCKIAAEKTPRTSGIKEKVQTLSMI